MFSLVVTISTWRASFTPLCSQLRATMGSPSRELDRTLSQLFTRYVAGVSVLQVCCRSVLKATRFLQDQEQTSGMEGQ
ncbi:hypothetical protein EYF80_058400 [Liparis tanakae]|uniref:Uncharacterized protein n=1 Tax=Liparis tanakae TaxID=230148 RepID=A0A4Z2ERB1_9TELE|nr:hypothetical protein EYF80_058400 [Liparis tanakae]